MHTNVPPQNIFDLFLLETTLDDQSLATVDGPRSTQLGKQELNDVFWLPVHLLADILDVCK